MKATSREPEDRREWWERRRLAFSVAVAAGYAVSVVIYELFTPWWAGDHFGLSVPALVFMYGPGALVCLAVANVVYWLPRMIEAKTALSVMIFRRRAFLVTICLGAVFPIAWLGVWILPAWLRHR